MSYKVCHYIENEVVYCKHWGESTVEGLRASIQEVNKLIKQSERPLVHTITEVGSVTKGLPLAESIKVSREGGHLPNLGWVIIAGEQNKLSRFISTTAASLFKRRVKHFDTLDEVKDFLSDVDKSLSWHKADESVFTDSVEAVLDH